MRMRKTMLNAVQKVKMAMGKKMPKLSMEYPKLNEGFEALPEKVQKKMMKGKKPKMAMAKKKAKMAMAKKKPKMMGMKKKAKMAMRKKK